MHMGMDMPDYLPNLHAALPYPKQLALAYPTVKECAQQ